jgi:hypothetical protein
LDSAFITSLVTDDGGVLTRGLYYLRNNRKQFLEVGLPEGADVWSVFIREKAVKPAKKEGVQAPAVTVLIPLPRSIDRGAAEDVARSLPPGGEQSFPLEIVYFLRAGEVRRLGGVLALATPVVDVPVSQIGLSVYLPVRRSYSYLSGTLRPEAAFVTRRREGIGLERILDLFTFSYRKAEPQYAVPSAPPPAPGGAQSAPFAEQQTEEDRSFKEKVQKKAYAGVEGSTAAGSLPVRISFPEQGINLRFKKLLAIDPHDKGARQASDELKAAVEGQGI